MTTTTTTPEIERAANTILAQHHTFHPVLKAWIARVASDPTYITRLVTFVESPDSADSREDATLDGCGVVVRGYAVELTYTTPISSYSSTFEQSSDEAITWLANAVVSFRRDGQPSGDTESRIGSTAIVITSLAAAVAEHVTNIANAYAEELANRS